MMTNSTLETGGAVAALIADSTIGQAFMSFPALSSAAVVILVAALMHFSFNRAPKLDLPVVGEPGSKVEKKHIVEGARKVICPGIT
jgi:hypothetical protein